MVEFQVRLYLIDVPDAGTFLFVLVWRLTMGYFIFCLSPLNLARIQCRFNEECGLYGGLDKR